MLCAPYGIHVLIESSSLIHPLPPLHTHTLTISAPLSFFLSHSCYLYFTFCYIYCNSNTRPPPPLTPHSRPPQVLALIVKCRKVIKILWPDAIIEEITFIDRSTRPSVGESDYDGSMFRCGACLWSPAGGETDGIEPTGGEAKLKKEEKSVSALSKHLPSHISLGSKCVTLSLSRTLTVTLTLTLSLTLTVASEGGYIYASLFPYFLPYFLPYFVSLLITS